MAFLKRSETAESSSAKVRAVGGDSSGDTLLALEGAHQAMRDARLVLGCIMVKVMIGGTTFIHLMEDMENAKQKHLRANTGKSRHKEGPPGWWTWAGLIESLTTHLGEMQLDQAKAVKHKEVMQAMAAQLALLVDPKALETQLNGQIIHCAFRTTHEKKEIIIEIYARNKHLELTMHMYAMLQDMFGATMLWGPAPPSKKEKQLKGCITELSKRK
jgi:hypothetical protein